MTPREISTGLARLKAMIDGEYSSCSLVFYSSGATFARNGEREMKINHEQALEKAYAAYAEPMISAIKHGEHMPNVETQIQAAIHAYNNAVFTAMSATDEPNPAGLKDDEKPDTVEYIRVDEHCRLLKAGVNEARIVALQYARDAVLTLKRKCNDTPEGQSALMIYEYAETAIHSLIQPPSDTPSPAHD
jgi:hypothetical protein